MVGARKRPRGKDEQEESASEAVEPVEKEVNSATSIDREEDGKGEEVPAKKKRGRKKKKKNLSAQKGRGAEKKEEVEENSGFQLEQGIVGDSDKEMIVKKPMKKRGRVGAAKKDTEDAVVGNEKDSNGAKLEVSSGRGTGTQRVYSLRAKNLPIPKQETAKINKHDPKVNITFPSLCFCWVLLLIKFDTLWIPQWIEEVSLMCHQCQRNDKGRVVRCKLCKRKRYCIPCLNTW